VLSCQVVRSKFRRFILMDIGIASTLLLFLMIWLVPFCAREFRNSGQLMLAYWFVIVLHQAVAFTNAFWFTTIGASADAVSFHRMAMEVAQLGHVVFNDGASFYYNMLGVVYWIFGPSLMLAQQLTILAFSISCVVLVKILCQLELSRHKVSIFLAFGALPSMVFLGSVPLRESYQILFYMLVVYFGLKMHVTGGVNKYLIFMIISALGMGLFHHALLVYAVFLIVLFLLWTHWPVSRLGNVKKVHVLAVFTIPALMLGAASYAATNSVALSAFFNMELLETAAKYREYSPSTRATYGANIDLSSPLMAIYSSLVMYIYYLFAPFPWQINNVLDVYASIESILRLVLICFAWKNWRNSYGAQRRQLGLMLTLFFSMSFMWGMGTTNYGTAIRHNMLSWWILVIVGLPLLMEWLSRFRLADLVHQSRVERG